MTVTIRPIEEDDLELLLAWRNHPDVYETLARREEEIAWEEHYDWFHEGRGDREDWTIVAGDEPMRRRVGTVTARDLDSDAPKTDVMIGEVTAWGEGLATDALRALLDELRDDGYGAARAEILPWNDPTIHLYENKLGYEATDEKTDHGEKVFRKEL